MNISLKSLFKHILKNEKRSVSWFYDRSAFRLLHFHIPRRSLAGEIVEMKTNDTHDPPSSIFKGFERLSTPINQTAMEYR